MSSIWSKEGLSIEDVEKALDECIAALKGEGERKHLAVAEEKLHATVMTYVRNQAHRKFPRWDASRAVDTSSALAGDILLYLYSRRHLPVFLQSVRDNPSEESKLEFIKRLQSLLFLKLRHLPVDWSRTREKIPKIFPVPEDINAISSEIVESAGEDLAYRELLSSVEQVLTGFSVDDQAIIQHRLFESLTFSQSAEKLGMKPDAVRKRYGNAVGRLRIELERLGFELK